MMPDLGARSGWGSRSAWAVGLCFVVLFGAEPCVGQQNATAPGGVAVGRDIRNSLITINNNVGEQDSLILKVLGFGFPLYFAVTTYGLFCWLDRNASPQANRTISKWLEGAPYRQINVRRGMLAIFDRLYSSPLLRLRAFFRSAIFSAIVWIIFKLHAILADATINGVSVGLILVIGSYMLAVILSDFVSLFVVRRVLATTGSHPLKSTVLAVAAGGLVISTCYVLGVMLGSMGVAIIMVGHNFSLLDYFHYTFPLFASSYQLWVETGPSIMMPAFLVHLWLLLFVVGAISVRLLYPILFAIAHAQWFLKQGNRHPLRAIGVVAAALAFTGAVIEKAIGAFT